MNKKTTKERIIHRRKWLTLKEKLDIIQLFEDGKTCSKIARENKMNESSVRAILAKKETYKSQAGSMTSLLSKVVSRQRSTLLNSVERDLITWIYDCYKKRIQLTELAIQRKALELFETLKEQEGGDVKEKFAASRGWFYRFRNRINLQNCMILSPYIYGDKEAAEKFCQNFVELVENEGYAPQQIFNVEETTLYWKRMPSQTFLAEMEKLQQGQKPSNDRLTLLMGGNASGDLKLKPLSVFRAQTPLALRDCEKITLPVIWRSNKKAWISQEIFDDWLQNYFTPLVESYCMSNNLEFKILLLLDFASTREVVPASQNIKIMFMTPNTAPVIQPMSQGIFAKLKACYLRQILSQAIEISSSNNDFSLQTFWKAYNVKNAIDNVSTAWNEITPEDMYSSWHKLLPDVKPKDFEAQVDEIAQDFITMGQYFGFHSLNIPDVKNCIENTKVTDLDNTNIEEQIVFKQEVCEMDEEVNGEEEVEETKDEIHSEEMKDEDLEKILESVDAACETIFAADSNTERSIKVRQILQNGIQSYREMYIQNMKKRNNAQE